MTQDNRPVKVQVRNLTKCFGKLHVLDNITFDIKKGEFICVVGPTGCGKTTFLILLTKIHEPTSGRTAHRRQNQQIRRSTIWPLCSEPSAYPWLTVEENLKFGLKIKRRLLMRFMSALRK